MTIKKKRQGMMEKKSKYDITNPAISGKDPTRRKRCPECGSDSYTISVLYGKLREVKNGKTIFNVLRRQDAGSFTCKGCGYYETV